MKASQRIQNYNSHLRLPYGFLQFFSGGGGGGAGGSGGNEPVTYTEEQVQARIKEATGAAVEKAIKDRFGDLAGMDLKEVRAAIELKKKADEESAAAAAKSKNKDKDGEDKGIAPEEVEKLLDERLKEREQEQEKQMFQRELRADVKVYASELGFADFEDAIALGDFSNVKRNDKGDLEGVKEALETLAKAKPHLLKRQPGSGAFGAQVPNSRGTEKKPNEEIINLAKNRGITANNQAAFDPWAKN